MTTEYEETDAVFWERLANLRGTQRAEATKDRDAYFADLLYKNSRLAEAERLLREIADDQDDRVSPGLRIAAQQFLAADSASGVTP